ncbi:MAG TPA: GspH/FimT family pseudopilin [Burkholderiaceae bacterium]
MPAGTASLKRRATGFTVVELCVAMAVLGVVAVLATPSFEEFRLRERVKGAANNLYADLQFARSESVQRNARVSLAFTTGTAWCYGIHEGNAACDCGVANSCNIKTVSSADYPRVTMAPASFVSASGTSNWYLIDPRVGQSIDAAGAAVNGTVQFGIGGRALRGEVNAMGRVRLCAAADPIPGYPAC